VDKELVWPQVERQKGMCLITKRIRPSPPRSLANIFFFWNWNVLDFLFSHSRDQKTILSESAFFWRSASGNALLLLLTLSFVGRGKPLHYYNIFACFLNGR
jgi:hypothetical protein